MMNTITAGRYADKIQSLMIYMGKPIVTIGFSGPKKGIPITAETASIEILERGGIDVQIDKTTSLGKATVGAVLLGPVGVVAGLGGKTKKTKVVTPNRVQIIWKDTGEKSIAEVDDKLMAHFDLMV